MDISSESIEDAGKDLDAVTFLRRLD